MSQSSYSPVESLARFGRRLALAYWLKNALRSIVVIHASKFDPGLNVSNALNPRSNVSCTRSCASSGLLVNFIACRYSAFTAGIASFSKRARFSSMVSALLSCSLTLPILRHRPAIRPRHRGERGAPPGTSLPRVRMHTLRKSKEIMA